MKKFSYVLAALATIAVAAPAVAQDRPMKEGMGMHRGHHRMMMRHEGRMMHRERHMMRHMRHRMKREGM